MNHTTRSALLRPDGPGMNHHQKGTQVNHAARSASLISRASSALGLVRPSSPAISHQPFRVRERSSLRTGFFAVLSDSLRGGGSGARSHDGIGLGFGGRTASLRAKGSGAPALRLLAPLALALTVLLALAASALAAPPTEFGSAGSGAGQINEPLLTNVRLRLADAGRIRSRLLARLRLTVAVDNGVPA